MYKRQLRDRGGQLAFFEDRESHLLETAAMRLRRAGEEGADSFAIFNDAQPHLLETARAHVDRVVLEAFVTAIDGCEDADARAVLDLVCDLYVFSTIEANRAWFLEHGRLSQTQAKGVIARVDELCAQLRPHAQTLVDAFAIPNAWRDTELLEFLGETSG